MRVLVTGGAGFVGSHLVRRLLSRGHTVTSLDRSAGLFDEELRTSGAVMLTGSVTDKADVDRAMAGQEVVYHLASPFGDILESDAGYWAIEVDGTRHVLESARRHRVNRVVHCSTQGVHGIIREPMGDEDSPVAPRDYYCYSKAEGENIVTEFLAEGMDVVIVRPTSVYGPGDTRGWLTLFRMAAKGWFLMIGDGRTYNHPVYVENLVDLFELVALAPNARGRTYLAADQEPVTLTQLVRSVGTAVGVRVRILRFPGMAPPGSAPRRSNLCAGESASSRPSSDADCPGFKPTAPSGSTGRARSSATHRASPCRTGCDAPRPGIVNRVTCLPPSTPSRPC